MLVAIGPLRKRQSKLTLTFFGQRRSLPDCQLALPGGNFLKKSTFLPSGLAVLFFLVIALPLDVWDILVAEQQSSEEWPIAIQSRSA
jgi:hypothetical protein